MYLDEGISVQYNLIYMLYSSLGSVKDGKVVLLDLQPRKIKLKIKILDY